MAASVAGQLTSLRIASTIPNRQRRAIAAGPLSTGPHPIRSNARPPIMVTRTYRLDHDLGFAPNPFFEWCSLACCMGDIRKHAKLNDVIVGMAGSGKQGLGRYH